MKKSYIVYAVLLIAIVAIIAGYITYQQPPSETRQWVPVTEWDNPASGGLPYNYTTGPFEIVNGTEWLVSWNIQANNYSNYNVNIKVYDASTNAQIQEVTSEYIANSSTHFTTKGRFYLRIVLNNNSPITCWKIAVWEYRSGPWIEGEPYKPKT